MEKNIGDISKDDVQDDVMHLITSIKCNDKEYELYTDGNLYEKLKDGCLKLVDRLNEDNKEIIEKLMSNFKPGQIDVVKTIDFENNEKHPKDIDVHEPEI